MHVFSWARLAAAQGVLAGALFSAAGLAAYLGWRQAGSEGVFAAGIALFVCWIPNAASLVMMSLLRDPQQSIVAVLLSMLLRMGLPFVLAFALLQTKHWLVGAGVLPMVMALYLIALIVETVLSLWIVGAFRAPAVKVS